ncbi:MAG: formate/nitrite transporter family protein [Demequina sp.]|nr:formate/nitrite transporter family protein [Demequina sp.]
MGGRKRSPTTWVPTGEDTADEDIGDAASTRPLYRRGPCVMKVLADHGAQRLMLLTGPRVFALAILAGSFITTGALMSILLAAGTHNEGLVRLIEGCGFSAGFFFVVLSEAVLFTETNVVLPAVLMGDRRPVLRVLRFWAQAPGGRSWSPGCSPVGWSAWRHSSRLWGAPSSASTSPSCSR